MSTFKNSLLILAISVICLPSCKKETAKPMASSGTQQNPQPPAQPKNDLQGTINAIPDAIKGYRADYVKNNKPNDSLLQAQAKVKVFTALKADNLKVRQARTNLFVQNGTEYNPSLYPSGILNQGFMDAYLEHYNEWRQNWQLGKYSHYQADSIFDSETIIDMDPIMSDTLSNARKSFKR
jgi:hypothetical protein